MEVNTSAIPVIQRPHEARLPSGCEDSFLCHKHRKCDYPVSVCLRVHCLNDEEFL